MMLQIPSLPFLPSASLPEVVWVTVSLIGTVVSIQAWLNDTKPRARLKNGIRSVTSGAFCLTGLGAMFNPPPANPTWLSVLTPIVIAFGVFSMSLLSVIDEQAKEAI